MRDLPEAWILSAAIRMLLIFAIKFLYYGILRSALSLLLEAGQEEIKFEKNV
jgi:hypothetical protein